ncbi:uncharacterized protein LOC117823506 [Notolabrus celidotus]|uniref:uncharacterized protein LOC117823506 n=1 Tax=Notolabrus celidotus TaxID=1203425 RepID=UPI00148FB3DD|nr:uncharacterized protein LOC117823506 [Notolabrus celidotus]
MTSAVVFVLLVFLGLTSGHTGINIAKGGKVYQSSLAHHGAPERAVDGNRASQWKDKSCTHTKNDLSPWWRLELEKTYKIHIVTITNRKDCCSDRINGAEIRIGNSLEDNGNANPRCAVITSISPGASQIFDCKGMIGRYVNIVIPNKREYLTLCEVEVTGDETGINIAKGGKVYQSSLAHHGAPERAVDGNRASQWKDKSCTHTKNDLSPWWRLELEKTYKIHIVTITNRKDCCSDRINGAEIRIGNSLEDNGNANPRCAVITSISPGASQIFDCKGMIGRYVNIVIPNKREYLTLCEVEVTGDETGINIAKGGKVYQSSLAHHGAPERAVDGNRASQWKDKSCTHTKNDLSPWWRLELEKTYKIHIVTITNRKDCCSDRINGAEIRIGNSLEDNGNANPRCAVITSISPGASQIFDCKGMIGRYVNIVIPNKREYLTLCEVEVTGDETGINIAKGGKVYQSSLAHHGAPERAVDGNRASQWKDKSCTHTKNDLSPWWRLELEKTYKIHIVTITNRKDCCSDRINGAEIRIGNSIDHNGNANPRCAVITSISPGASQTFDCKGMIGRYVNIVIPNKREYLTLCEVEVTGDETDEESDEFICN